MTAPALVDPSPDAMLVKRLVDAIGKEAAHQAIDEMLAQFSTVELAALAAYSPMWMRGKQRPPDHDWRSWLLLTSRGWGKTDAVTRFIVEEIIEGRAMRIGLAAQNETKTMAVQVKGLIAAAPPWFTPQWVATSLELQWPNGATALAFTPEVPGAIRSENFDLAWLSEIQSWPMATREEAYSNFLFATRVGRARTIVDCTPKKGHPIIKRLVARANEDPVKHHITRGAIYENPHLSAGVVADMEKEYSGTQKGREELLGEMPEESEKATVKQAWIDGARRAMPVRLKRRVISIDPATSSGRGSDNTGILDVGAGVDDQAFVCGDYTGRHPAEIWAPMVIRLYFAGQCDCVVVETNKGGNLLTSNLRAHAQLVGVNVEVVGKDWAPRHVPGTIYVKEIHARGAKEDRAAPISSAYERGRVSHVIGVDLTELEETITTWEPQPGAKSPDRLDALVHGVIEVLGLSEHKPDKRKAFVGIGKMAEALQAPSPKAPKSKGLAALLSRSGGHGRI